MAVCLGSLAEQVGMRARAGQQHFCVSSLVYQQPIGLDVTLAPALPLAFQGMISPSRRKRLIAAQGVNHPFEKRTIVAAPLDSLEVSTERTRKPKGFYARRGVRFLTALSKTSPVGSV